MEFNQEMEKIKESVNEIINRDLNDWAVKLNELAYSYITYEKIVEDKKSFLSKNLKVKQTKELQTMKEVTEKLTDEGKKAYPNSELREAAKYTILNENEGYQSLLKNIEEGEMDIKEYELLAKYLYISLSNLKSILRARGGEQ